MSNNPALKSLSRRDFLKLGSGAMGVAVGGGLLSKVLLQPDAVSAVSAPLTGPLSGPAAPNAAVDLHLAATDGYIYLPEDATVPPYFPDDTAPAGLNTYIFGYRNVSTFGTDTNKIYQQKMRSQLSAPLFILQEEVGFTLQLTNLGLQMRPDLIDSHTLHFHGFRNAIPIFDGEPHSSVGVPIIRDLQYYYYPRNPGTYMYHCHFEETEHVHMGMVGPTFIRPKQNLGGGGLPAAKLITTNWGDPSAPTGYAYNDAWPIGHPASTAYDREYMLLLSEIWAEAHWDDSHIQLPEWSDYRADFFLINGRAYPQTLWGNGSQLPDPNSPDGDLPGVPDENGDLHPELRYQPLSALIKAHPGERILLRFANLGFTVQSLAISGITVRIIAKDAAYLKGRDDTDLTYTSNTIYIGPGESADAIFTAPAFDGAHVTTDPQGRRYNRYLLFNRNYARLSNGGHAGNGGQMTEVRVYDPNHSPSQLPPQTYPNE
jgi:FtsP/CotA-like multicopper oxidase with cupredoxin domain